MSVKRLIKTAIESEIGKIDSLPQEVSVRIREIYEQFVPIYADIIRKREGPGNQTQITAIVIDPEVVEDMLHFFSDYQDLARSFKTINRQVKRLKKIDRLAEPHRYASCVEQIVSGGADASIMDSLLDR